jgi:hypothetical protein
MAEFIYSNYVRTLSRRFVANIDAIVAGYNFEYGPEFEVAICETLRSALPDRFGIARGYVVDANGSKAGDDILIYERSRFPTLALRDRDDYGRKEFVPIEATFCYVEAKHTLHLEGDDPQSLSRACEQVSMVKGLCSTRAEMLPEEIMPKVNLKGAGVQVSLPPGYPRIQNPAFGAIFARQVKRNKGGPTLTNPHEIESVLSTVEIPGPEQPPDLIVLGESNVIVPVLPKEESGEFQLRSPFFIPGKSSYHFRTVQNIAFGVALASVMEALDWIQLGAMPWRDILVDGLGISRS